MSRLTKDDIFRLVEEEDVEVLEEEKKVQLAQMDAAWNELVESIQTLKKS